MAENARHPDSGMVPPSEATAGSPMRSSWQVTWSVWHALFLREVLARTTANRFAWLWMLVEPLLFVVVWLAMHSLMGRVDVITGADYIPWLLVGITGFFVFREGVQRSVGAVQSNQALFTYRQVKPVDPVLVRNALEGLLKTIVLVLLILGASLMGYDTLPDTPLLALLAWVTLWLLGLGSGLIVSVGAALIPEIALAVRIAMLPLFVVSGAISPLQLLPPDIQEILSYNPVLHGVEYLRLAFFADYQSLDRVSALFLGYWVLALLVIGLALHVRFARRLQTK
ncbi:MAG: ABC transporter permease [Salinisphaera sp.]|nr:ABC transporter permease [Salinisphaera sp.]